MGNEWNGFGMYTVHHVASLLSWGIAGATGLLHNVLVPILLLEATGPFTNMRWCLHTAGYKETKTYIVNGVMMFLSFFVLRVVFNWWLWFQRVVMQHEEVMVLPPYIKFLTWCLFPVNLVLQLLWFQKILNGVLAL